VADPYSSVRSAPIDKWPCASAVREQAEMGDRQVERSQRLVSDLGDAGVTAQEAPQGTSASAQRLKLTGGGPRPWRINVAEFKLVI